MWSCVDLLWIVPPRRRVHTGTNVDIRMSNFALSFDPQVDSLNSPRRWNKSTRVDRPHVRIFRKSEAIRLWKGSSVELGRRRARGSLAVADGRTGIRADVGRHLGAGMPGRDRDGRCSRAAPPHRSVATDDRLQPLVSPRSINSARKRTTDGSRYESGIGRQSDTKSDNRRRRDRVGLNERRLISFLTAKWYRQRREECAYSASPHPSLELCHLP